LSQERRGCLRPVGHVGLNCSRVTMRRTSASEFDRDSQESRGRVDGIQDENDSARPRSY
jgi:hypothetical protein